MFVRKKKNKSGLISFKIINKCSGQYRVLKTIGNSKDTIEIERLFPNVNKIVKYYKKEDYGELAINLQKVEADIMINHVVPRLAEKNIYVLTIHDSIVTLPGHAEFVKQTILKVFNEKYGLVPTVKVK